AYTATWYATVVLIIITTVLVGKPLPMDARNALLITAVALAGLTMFWRRHLFLPSDFVALIHDEGGVVVYRRWWRSVIKARRRDLWIIARLDGALGYARNGQSVHDVEEDRRPRWALISQRWERIYRVTRRGLIAQRDSGEYMLFRGSVNLFRLELLRDVSRLIVVVSRDGIPETGDPRLDPALRQAAAVSNDPGTSVTVERAMSWLRVEVRGGAWLGVMFGRRISEAIRFMDRLTQAMEQHFTALDPARWTIELRDHAFVVRETGFTGAA